MTDYSKQAAEIFSKHAAKYQEKFMSVDLYKDTLDIFCDAIKPKNAEVLELACGPGNVTKYLLEKRHDLKIHGTDLAPNMLELAIINNPTATFELLDSRDILKLNKHFDGIMCAFGLPYLSKAEAIKLIHDAYRSLKDGGIFYISTMEDDNSKSDFKAGSQGDLIFMNYHESGYLSEAFMRNGFEIIELKQQDYPTTDGTKVTDLIIIGKK